MLASVLIMICTFLLDEVTHQTYVSIYSVAGWSIMMLLLISIAKNMYVVTRWDVIPFLSRILKNRLQSQTGENPDFENN